ncbi:MAG TPA: acetylglutamate kinase [Cytophagaceae bacterium]|jgi:acetylglutamate kinase|nr:acetylglutamate kinase [Cytophagaceae bacterium]
MEKLYVIKIGGNIIEDAKVLDDFLCNFASLNCYKVLIHGGGKNATQFANDIGIEAQFVEGRRITDEKMLRIVQQIYTSLNQEIIIKLFNLGCKATGITGKDGKIINAVKRAPLNGIDYGFVGDIREVNGEFLSDIIIKDQSIPVLSPIVYDIQTKKVLNTNADTIAYNVAKSLISKFEVHLIYCFELKGVLENFEDKNSVISEITPAKYSELKEKGIISKGMIPKMDNSFDAIHSGVTSVRICHADDLVDIINKEELKGTKLHK